MGAQPLDLLSSDGTRLAGMRFGAGPSQVALVHDAGADMDALVPLAAAFRDDGFAVVSIDLRGHGTSDGEWAVERLADDVEAAIDAAARQAGDVFLVAVGAAATASLLTSRSDDLGALVLVSPRELPGLGVEEAIRRASTPKLFLIGSQEPGHAAFARSLYESAIGPRLLVQLPTESQGHDLFTGPHAEQAYNHTISFLVHHRSADSDLETEE